MRSRASSASLPGDHLAGLQFTSDGKSLLGLTPKTARVVMEHEEHDMPVEQITPGMRIRIRPGERVPVDGVVEEGNCAIDESTITGEPLGSHDQAWTAASTRG